MPLFISRSSFDGHEEGSILESNDEAVSEGQSKDVKPTTRQLPTWLSNSIPDEFLVGNIFYGLIV